jgi:hypothetical protein
MIFNCLGSTPDHLNIAVQVHHAAHCQRYDHRFKSDRPDGRSIGSTSYRNQYLPYFLQAKFHGVWQAIPVLAS